MVGDAGSGAGAASAFGAGVGGASFGIAFALATDSLAERANSMDLCLSSAVFFATSALSCSTLAAAALPACSRRLASVKAFFNSVAPWRLAGVELSVRRPPGRGPS